jgi:hypothetical protein
MKIDCKLIFGILQHIEQYEHAEEEHDEAKQKQHSQSIH